MVAPGSEALGGFHWVADTWFRHRFFFTIQGFVTNYYNLKTLKFNAIDKLRRELPALEKEV